VSELNRLYETYGEQVHVFVVYIREAHAADSARPDPRLDVDEPQTFSERLGVADTCREDLGLTLPMLVDDMENSTDAKYSAKPDRLFLVDTQGPIAYRGDRGPRGFKPAELEAAIKSLLASLPAAERSEEELDAIRERLKARRKAQQGAGDE
jgi:hypothetical protein